jgi:gliding motility-associated-like protein
VISGCPSTISVNADVTIGTCGTNVTWIAPTVTDNCVVTMTGDKTPGQFFAVGTTAVTYTATDASGNISTCTFNVVVNDVTNPVISGCPSTITVNADATAGTCGTNVTWIAPTVTDNCLVNMTSNKNPGQFFSVGTTAVTYTATDASGNISTCTFNVVVNDVTNPVISGCPSTISVNADVTIGTCGTNVTWTPPTVTDNCVVTMTGDKTPGQFFPVGTTAVTYTATDASGNISTCVFNIVVNDVTNPVISGCPSNISVNADVTTGTCGTNVTWIAPTVTDNCVVTMTGDKTPGQFFSVGTTAVTYTATDASGNISTCTFNVVVTDSSVPVVTLCTADVSAQLTGTTCSTTVNWVPPTFSDNCTLAISSTHNPSDIFPVGITNVVYTATDASGNSATCEFKITVTDQAAPVFASCPGNISIHAIDNCSASVSWIPPNVIDNCPVTIISTHPPGTIFAAGSTLVTYTATDASGNSATCTFTVTITDGSEPVFTSCPSTVSVSADANCEGKATWSIPTFTDCSTVTMTSTHSSGAQFLIGTTPVTYTATDASGNVATCNFNVVVTDNTAPAFSSCPSEITLTASSTCDAKATWTPPTATDNCGVTSLISSHSPGATFPIGISTVVYTAKDAKGNTSTCEFKVIVKNVTLPVIQNAPQNVVVKVIDTDKTSATWQAPTATVPCGSVMLSSNYTPGQEFPVGQTLVEYIAVDEAGNLSTSSFLIIVQYEDLEFEISKLVTPDGDGLNDVWTLRNLEKFRENKVTVFDRWGGVVFSASGYNNETVAWDGLSRNGSAVPTGTYFYTITVRYREDYLEKKGFIELVR